MMYRCSSCLVVAVMALCVIPFSVCAQDLNVDSSIVKLLTLNNLGSVSGVVLSVDSTSVSVRKLDGVLTEIPRKSIMNIDEIYRFVDNVPGGSKLYSDTSIFTLRLIGGIAVTGRTVSKSSSGLIFRLQEGGLIRIPVGSIKGKPEKRERHKTVDTVDYAKSANHFSCHDLFIAPTGRPIGKGRVTLGVTEVLLFGGSSGLFDFLTFSGCLFAVGGSAAAKLSFPGPEWLHVSGGATYLKSMDGSCFMPYAAVTVGTEDLALTADYLYGMHKDDRENRLYSRILVVGGECRISKELKLLVENWITLENDNQTSLAMSFMGFRIFASRSISLDLGMLLCKKFFDLDFVWDDVKGSASIYPWGSLRFNM